MDRLDRDFGAELRAASAKIDQNLMPETIPFKMEVVDSNTYAVFKRSNKGQNLRLLMGLPIKEAVFWSSKFNKREIEKRADMATIPEEVWFFDCVREGTEEENPYWNKENTMEEII